MPTRTQSYVAPVAQACTSHELEMLWEDVAEDRLEHGGRSPEEQCGAHAKRIWEPVEFEAARDSPGEARRKVVMALRGRGCGEVLVQDAALVVTEMAANAVVHARSSFSVSISLRNSMLRIDVADGGPIAPGPTNQDWVPRQGHGLGLINALCTRWGTDATTEGKVVWGELQL
jgi:anti-sigma regulatory factor (Ser/Thr protein kinase)